MLGAKRFEWRKWDYRTRNKNIEGERIVIHAAARPMKSGNIQDIINRIEAGTSDLKPEIALPLLERIWRAPKEEPVVALAAGLGTAVLGRPRPATKIFAGSKTLDPDPAIWGWPLTDIEQWDVPVPMRGFQGFWNWPERIAA